MLTHIGRSIIECIDRLSEQIGITISWLNLVMVTVTALIVILRYVFNLGWISMQESVTYMHSFVFMLGAAYTLKHDGHVRVDIFYHRFRRSTRAWIDLFGTLLLLMPVCIFILWSSWSYVYNSWLIFEGSREAGGLPAVYLLKTSILLMAALLVLQGVSLILSNFFIILESRKRRISK